MILHPEGREFCRWPVASTSTPTPPIELSIDGGRTWHPTEPDGSGVRALLAGPFARSNPDGTIVLRTGVNRFAARVVDAPETIIRFAGDIVCAYPPAP